MRITILITATAFILSAGIAFADPDNFGGKGKAWKETDLPGGGTFHQNTKNPGQWKKWDAPGGKWFTQPGNAEGKANRRSVIPNDQIHPGAQVLPGSN